MRNRPSSYNFGLNLPCEIQTYKSQNEKNDAVEISFIRSLIPFNQC